MDNFFILLSLLLGIYFVSSTEDLRNCDNEERLVVTKSDMYQETKCLQEIEPSYQCEESTEEIFFNQDSGDYYYYLSEDSLTDEGDHLKKESVLPVTDEELNSSSLLISPVYPGQISILRNMNHKIFVDHTYRIGLPSNLSSVLFTYCNKRGITEFFHKLTSPNGSFSEGEKKYVELDGGFNWMVHRPDTQWNSNMHWISPGDEFAHEDYLKALGEAGFDEVLQAIGDEFDHIDGLVCYHLTFIAVSHCTKGYMHYDFTGTENRGFNLIIPLRDVHDWVVFFSVEEDGNLLLPQNLVTEIFDLLF